MESTIDALGRVVIPKALRDELGLTPGSKIDISRYGGGVHIEPEARTATLVREGKYLVARGEGTLTDEQMYALIDLGRR